MTKLTICALAVAAGCTTQPDAPDTTAVTSAVTDWDPAWFHLHAPGGPDIQVQTGGGGTPLGGNPNMFLKIDGITGETTDGHGHHDGDALFVGKLTGGTSPADDTHAAAAVAPLTAVLLGVATTDDFTAVTGLGLDPAVLHPLGDPPPPALATAIIQQSAGYALITQGTDAGALASVWAAQFGIEPCPLGGDSGKLPGGGGDDGK